MSQSAEPPLNALTVDVEDYFHVSAFDSCVRRADWGRFESRVSRNTDRLLEMFDRSRVRATFFVLGWVAERDPRLVARIAAAGHEIASHGYEHRLVFEQTRREFRDDVRRARAALNAAAGVPVLGYRAPSFSVTDRSLWALEVLCEEGYVYDASVFPIRHDRYGMPSWPRHFQPLQFAAGTLWECPASTVRIAGVNLPVGGGGYFRHLPYAWTRWGICRINRVDRQPVIFYLHPWEIDPDQPRLPVRRLSAFRHYRNLHKTASRLTRLLGDFRFAPLAEVLGMVAPSAARVPSSSTVSHTPPTFDMRVTGM